MSLPTQLRTLQPSKVRGADLEFSLEPGGCRVRRRGPWRLLVVAADGRPATPTVVILDEDGEEVGCWIERPVPQRDF
ncbi:MAG: hypothetical protein JSU98_09805 [Gemmatimonadales bacterium]|nr:MAG: hypothetical protein JSU98_09805 [Gemmatimonadales bacterium]